MNAPVHGGVTAGPNGRRFGLGDYKLGKAGSACDQAAPSLSPARVRFRVALQPNS